MDPAEIGEQWVRARSRWWSNPKIVVGAFAPDRMPSDKAAIMKRMVKSKFLQYLMPAWRIERINPWPHEILPQAGERLAAIQIECKESLRKWSPFKAECWISWPKLRHNERMTSNRFASFVARIRCQLIARQKRVGYDARKILALHHRASTFPI